MCASIQLNIEQIVYAGDRTRHPITFPPQKDLCSIGGHIVVETVHATAVLTQSTMSITIGIFSCKQAKVECHSVRKIYLLAFR